MLDSIHLINFRSHKNTFIELHPGINIFTGPNDSGKTNVLRGIDLVVNNHPAGDDYISKWGGNLDVKLGIDGKQVGRFRDAHWDEELKRFKAGTKNYYTLTHEDGEVEPPFKSFGRGKVPEIIANLLNISSTNIHFQLDGPFLLNKSPADVARHYNEIVNLDIIDRTISNIAGTLRKERAELKVEKAKIEEKTEKLEEYDWLPKAECELARLEKMQRAISGLKSDWTELHGLIRDHERLTAVSIELDKIVKHDEGVEKLLWLDKEIKAGDVEYLALKSLIDKLEALTETSQQMDRIVKYENTVIQLLQQAEKVKLLRGDVEALKAIVEEAARLKKEESKCQEIIKHEDEVSRLVELDTKIAENTDEYNALFDLVEKWEGLDGQLVTADNNLANLELEFKEAMPEICPLCEQEIKNTP